MSSILLGFDWLSVWRLRQSMYGSFLIAGDLIYLFTFPSPYIKSMQLSGGIYTTFYQSLRGISFHMEDIGK